MLILSNYKDYYDFLQGKYGRDPLRTYERYCSTEQKKHDWVKSGIYKPPFIDYIVSPPDYHFQMIAIAGTIYCVYYYLGKFYFGEESKAIPDTVTESWRHSERRDDKRAAVCHGMKTDINEKENCPVLLVNENHIWHYDSKTEINSIVKAEYTADVKNPKLADFQMAKCLDAEKCYLAISDFLGREKPIVDKRTDLQKITGKGFDKKYGFRTRPKGVQ